MNPMKPSFFLSSILIPRRFPSDPPIFLTGKSVLVDPTFVRTWRMEEITLRTNPSPYFFVIHSILPFSTSLPLGGELPTNRGCGLVHPGYNPGFLNGIFVGASRPRKSLGWTNPQPRFVGWTTKHEPSRSWSPPWSPPSSIASPPSPPPWTPTSRCAARGPGRLRHGGRSTGAKGATWPVLDGRRKWCKVVPSPVVSWFINHSNPWQV